MFESSLCYVEHDNCYLMLYRNKKEKDANRGKWIGVGGKIEEGETPDECVRREVFEETGLRPDFFTFLGKIDFVSDMYEDEAMYLFTAGLNTSVPAEEIELIDCNEGELKWIPKNEVLDLNLWEGDRCFLKPMLEGRTNLNMKLIYSGEKLLRAEQQSSR